MLRNGGTCTPSLWLPAHSVNAHTGYLSLLAPNLYRYSMSVKTKLVKGLLSVKGLVTGLNASTQLPFKGPPTCCRWTWRCNLTMPYHMLSASKIPMQEFLGDSRYRQQKVWREADALSPRE
eukprot:1152004-Pelagomonas_calceolata.AAC.1